MKCLRGFEFFLTELSIHICVSKILNYLYLRYPDKSNYVNQVCISRKK